MPWRPHRLLRALPPETAHALALAAIRRWPFRPPAAPPSLATDFAGLRLAHPVGLAAGFDKDGSAIDGLFRLGFASVELGTVTLRPQPGNPKPRLFRLTADRALINRLGFNGAGAAAMARRLRDRPRGAGVVGVNLGINRDSADPLADYRQVFAELAGLADYVTVNVSSPNTPGLRDWQGPPGLARLLPALFDARACLRLARPLPLLLKIAPDLTALAAVDVGRAAVAAGWDGLVVANTTLARPPDLRSRHKDEPGGLSGRPLFAPSTELLRRLRDALGPTPILVGVGGIDSAATALTKLQAGATAVQLYTGLVEEGPGLIREIVEGLAGIDRGQAAQAGSLPAGRPD